MLLNWILMIVDCINIAMFVLTWNKRKLLSFGILFLYALMQFSVSCFKTSNEGLQGDNFQFLVISNHGHVQLLQ